MEVASKAPAPKQNNTSHNSFTEQEARYFVRKTGRFYKWFFPLTYKEAEKKLGEKTRQLLSEKEKKIGINNERTIKEIDAKARDGIIKLFAETRILRIIYFLKDDFYEGVAAAANETIRNVLRSYQKPNGSAQTLPIAHDTMDLSHLKVER
jgi:hypothetical protein